MTDPIHPPCCSGPSPCCGSPAPPPPLKRRPWKAFIFILVLLVGAALAAPSLMAKKDACAGPGCCSEPCEK